MSLVKSLRRVDGAVARVEAGIAAVVLLSMIVVAVTQAVLRTLTAFQIEAANTALGHFTWADPVLQKGTLWVAFLGASLATHDDKHIAIDVLHRIVPPRVKSAMQGFVGIVAAFVCFGLAYVFRLSIANNAGDIPLELSVMDATGQSVHVCGISAAQALEAGVERPGIFCAVRGALGMVGQDVATMTNALELIVPFGCVVMGIRFFFKGIGNSMEAVKPGMLGDEPKAEQIRTH